MKSLTVSIYSPDSGLEAISELTDDPTSSKYFSLKQSYKSYKLKQMVQTMNKTICFLSKYKESILFPPQRAYSTCLFMTKIFGQTT